VPEDNFVGWEPSASTGFSMLDTPESVVTPAEVNVKRKNRKKVVVKIIFILELNSILISISKDLSKQSIYCI